MSLPKTFMASDLAAALEALVAKHGDHPVVLKDPDTRYRLEISVVFREPKAAEGWPSRYEITADYHGRPKGNAP